MSSKNTPKKVTKSAPKKRVKPRGREVKAATPGPIIGSPVIGESESEGSFGVRGSHNGEIAGVSGTGVQGNGPVGISGSSQMGIAVSGTVRLGNSVAVLGRHLDVGGPGGHGVRGEGAIGVFGTSSRDGFPAVAGEDTGAGFGVLGDTAEGNTAGVFGRHKGAFEGHGVRGEGPIGVFGKGTPGVDGICPASGGESGTPSGSLAGVRGNAQSGPGVFGAGGYGGQFTGTKAQLHLVPGTILGRPTTDFHEKGEMFIDVAGDLFVCVAGGNPGNWRKVMTVAA